MGTQKIIRNSLATSAAADGAIIFPTMLINKNRLAQSDAGAADQALDYYRSVGFFGDRSTMNHHGYGEVIRSLNSEPPWVESIKIDELERLSEERESELRPLTKHVQETSDDILFEKFHQFLLERDSKVGIFRQLDQRYKTYRQLTQLEEFKKIVALARLIEPDLAFQLEQRLLYEYGDDSFGFQVASGAPDLLIWTQQAESGFWFFSEVKASGDYLRQTQKDWLKNHWELLEGRFLLTILE